MESPENNELEKFIDAQLRKLPERQAPEALMSDVFAAIVAREARPWWKQSFTFWPRPLQSLLFVSLALVFLAALYASNRAARKIQVPDVSEQLSSYAWLGQSLHSLADAVFLAVSSLPLDWWIGIGVVFALLYGACIAAGVALFKLTSSAASRTA